jgi:hypothetical protein
MCTRHPSVGHAPATDIQRGRVSIPAVRRSDSQLSTRIQVFLSTSHLRRIARQFKDHDPLFIPLVPFQHFLRFAEKILLDTFIDKK